MARNEEVRYTCDICGNTANAQRVQHPDGRGWNFVRPQGWGNVFAKVQDGPDQITLKKDFCSEDCFDTAVDEFKDRSYTEA